MSGVGLGIQGGGTAFKPLIGPLIGFVTRSRRALRLSP